MACQGLGELVFLEKTVHRISDMGWRKSVAVRVQVYDRLQQLGAAGSQLAGTLERGDLLTTMAGTGSGPREGFEIRSAYFSPARAGPRTSSFCDRLRQQRESGLMVRSTDGSVYAARWQCVKPRRVLPGPSGCLNMAVDARYLVAFRGRQDVRKAGLCFV